MNKEDESARKQLRQLMAKMSRHRRRLRINQEAMARRLNTTQSAVSQMETIAIEPRFTTIVRYAKALGLRLRITIELDED